MEACMDPPSCTNVPNSSSQHCSHSPNVSFVLSMHRFQAPWQPITTSQSSIDTPGPCFKGFWKADFQSNSRVTQLWVNLSHTKTLWLRNYIERCCLNHQGFPVADLALETTRHHIPLGYSIRICSTFCLHVEPLLAHRHTEQHSRVYIHVVRFNKILILPILLLPWHVCHPQCSLAHCVVVLQGSVLLAGLHQPFHTFL